ncbi:hypothetical protein REC_193 [Pseudomonas phage REC]|nr:hypothetical protein REC_193 [Pseudomonas phage REC]UGL62596.1 hypothetical protein [Pseudomonas phage REC1]
MSFIALALTLCTFVGPDQDGVSSQFVPDHCNTYFIDAFAGDFVEGEKEPEAKPMADQWGDCMTRLDEETMLARAAARSDRATKPTAKDGQYTANREAYLKRFNIVTDVQSIDRWEYGCAKVAEADTP